MRVREHLPASSRSARSGRRRRRRSSRRLEVPRSSSSRREGPSTSRSSRRGAPCSTSIPRRASLVDRPPTAGTRSPALVGARRNRVLSGTTRRSSRSSERASRVCPHSRSLRRSSSLEREHMPFPVIADPELKLRDALDASDLRVRWGDALQAGHARLRGRARRAMSSIPCSRPIATQRTSLDWLRTR